MKKEIIDKLNACNFHKCEDIKVGDVLYYDILLHDKSKKLAIRSLIKSFLYSVSSIYQVDVKETTTNNVALYSKSCSGRRDHSLAFDDAVGLINNCLILKAGKKRLCLRRVNVIVDYFKWVHEFKVAELDLSSRLILAYYLLQAYLTYVDLLFIMKKNQIIVKNFITWCDVMTDDSFVTQKLNQKKINTITYCHADFNIKINEAAWAYSGSNSKAMLVHSPHSKMNALEAKYKGRILVAGNPHNISKTPREHKRCSKVESIGLVLNSEMIGEANAGMIKTLQEYCKKTKKKLIIKMHPSNSFEKISSYIDSDVTELHYKDINIQQFNDLIDVAIISNSSMTLFN